MSFTDFGPDTPFASVGDYGQVDYALMNKGVTPIFFIEPVYNQRRSDEEGKPCFDEMERVKIVVAGDRDNQTVLPVDDAVKMRFADQYHRWQANKQEKHIDGTPLKEWPLLSISQIAELEAINIFSVEQLAGVSDSNVTRIHSGREWRSKAAAWLAKASDGASVTKLAAENERQRQDIEDLRKTVAELSARLSEHADEDRPRRGRPPKAA